MQVGATKDQSLYNKPSAAVHPGALAAGTLTQYNTILLPTSECQNLSKAICSSPISQEQRYQQFLHQNICIYQLTT